MEGALLVIFVLLAYVVSTKSLGHRHIRHWNLHRLRIRHRHLRHYRIRHRHRHLRPLHHHHLLPHCHLRRLRRLRRPVLIIVAQVVRVVGIDVEGDVGRDEG